MPSPLNLFLLGPFHAERRGLPVTSFESEKARGLLAYLALSAAFPAPRESLVEMFWPDLPPRAGRHNLSQALSSLRRTLAEDNAAPFFLADRQTVQFNLAAAAWIDVGAFEDLLDACRRCDHARPELCEACAGRRRQAVELYRGDFLTGLAVDAGSAFDDWAALRRERLHRLALGALDWLAAYHESRGELADAEGCARRQVALEPWREEAHRGLMRLLAHGGQRGAALAQFEVCRRVLADELGVTPTLATTRLYERIRDSAKGRLRRLPPQPTPFVGRRAELAQCAGLLASADCRLLTLLGPGGAGKSRLALALAERLDARFLEGVCFVPLASLTTPDEVAPAIAAALGLTYGQREPATQVLSFLRDKEMLLILDNVEHLGGIASWLSDVLGAAPGLKLLATSRERLRLRWEQVFEVAGLAGPTAAPEAAAPEAAVAALSEAEHFFLTVARRGQPGLVLERDDRPALARLCRVVEGLPLALELAAAALRARTLPEIAASVAANAGMLSTALRDVPARQRSVRATLDYSFSLLDAPARDLLVALGVFRGSFDAETARQIAAAGRARLEELADKSLLRREGGGRYGLHELVRQYAAEKLATSPEREDRLARHDAAYAARADALAPELRGAGIAAALDRLERDHADIQVAWERALAAQDGATIDRLWHVQSIYFAVRGLRRRGLEEFAAAHDAFADDPERSTRFANRLGHFQRLSQEYDAGERTLRAAAAAAAERGAAGTEAYAWIELAHLLVARGDLTAGDAAARRGIALLGEGEGADEALMRTHALMALGNVAMHRGELPAARAWQEECRALAARHGFVLILADALSNLGIVEGMSGQFGPASGLLRESLALREEVGDLRGQGISLANLGLCALSEGDLDGAAAAFAGSLRLCDRIGDRDGAAYAIDNFGEIALRRGQFEEARRSFQRSLELRRELGDRAGLAYSLAHLAQTRDLTDETEMVRRDLREALELALETGGAPLVLLVGQVVSQTLAPPAQAAAWLALIQAHPALDQRFAPEIEAHQGKLRAALGEERWEAARETGATLDWEAFIAGLEDLLRDGD